MGLTPRLGRNSGCGSTLGVMVGLAVAVGLIMAWRPSCPPPVICESASYIVDVIERAVVRCEPGSTLQVSADGEGRIIAWCEKE